MEGANAADENNAKAVGERFLVEYYKAASEDTAHLQRFYRKTAVCSFDDETLIVGSAKIGEKLAILYGAVFDLMKDGPTCAFQTSPDGGILILVAGHVSLRNAAGGHDAPRRFVQTFNLSRKEQNMYAIANDMHRFITIGGAPSAESKPVQAAAPAPQAIAPTNGQATTEGKKEEAKPQPVEPKTVVQEAATEAPVKPSPAVPVASKSEKPARANKATPAAATQPSAPPAKEEKEAAPAKPTGPPSYAQAARSSPQAATSNGVTKSAAAKPQEKPKASPETQAASPRPASPPPNASIYVKNGQSVAQQALSDALAAVFGPVVSATVKGSGTVITLSGPKEVENALAAKEIVVEGSTLLLEVYRGTSSSNSRGGQRRGAAPTDGAKRSSGGSSKPKSDKPSSGDRSGTGKPASAQQRSSGGAGGAGGKPRGGGAKPAEPAQ